MNQIPNDWQALRLSLLYKPMVVPQMLRSTKQTSLISYLLVDRKVGSYKDYLWTQLEFGLEVESYLKTLSSFLFLEGSLIHWMTEPFHGRPTVSWLVKVDRRLSLYSLMLSHQSSGPWVRKLQTVIGIMIPTKNYFSLRIHHHQDQDDGWREKERQSGSSSRP